MVASRTSEFWSFFDSSITKKAPAFKDITIFEVNTQKLYFELRSGISSEQWANGNGRDSSVKYSFDFANSGESEYENSLVRSITSTAMDSESLEIVPTQLLMVPGALASNQEVTVIGVVNNGHLINFTKNLARNEARIPFSSLLPETLRSFSIDDSAHPIIERTIDGTWNMTMNFHRRYTAGKESNMFDADLNLRCVNGSIEGEMHLVNRPASPRKFNGKLAVSGPCADEAGRIEFRFQYANDVQEQLVKIPYERIGGSPKSRRLLTRDLGEDSSASYNGAKYSMFLPMHTEDGSQGEASTK